MTIASRRAAVAAATVVGVQPLPERPPSGRALLDPDSRAWLAALRGGGATRDEAVERLHELLLRASRFEVARRRPLLPHLRGEELEDVALQSADDAVVSVLARLDDFRGASRFSTWAYKFALFEAAAALRKRAWQGRELPLEDASWETLAATALRPDAAAEQSELLGRLQEGIRTALTPHQRRVLLALAVDGVPIDVLADRLGTTRGALYKTLHDGRARLRRHLHDAGLDVGGAREEGP